jgi:hypothetical protein
MIILVEEWKRKSRNLIGNKPETRAWRERIHGWKLNWIKLDWRWVRSESLTMKEIWIWVRCVFYFFLLFVQLASIDFVIMQWEVRKLIVFGLFLFLYDFFLKWNEREEKKKKSVLPPATNISKSVFFRFIE